MKEKEKATGSGGEWVGHWAAGVSCPLALPGQRWSELAGTSLWDGPTPCPQVYSAWGKLKAKQGRPMWR